MIIIIAEVLFWVLILLGMVCRYVFRLEKLSKFLLLAVPLVDVCLIIAVVAELRAGKPVSLEYQLAGLYLGISVVLGPGIVQWCDTKARELRTGVKSEKPSSTTVREKFRDELVFFAKWCLAMGVAFVVCRVLMFVAVSDEQRAALSQASTMPLSTIPFVAFFGPGWVLLFEKESEQKGNEDQPTA